MSAKTKARVKRYVSNWTTALNAQNGDAFAPAERQASRFCFVTLTLPSAQHHDDNELKRKCLSWLLVLLKRQHGVSSYLWRAETQKNGNLHFHLLIDRPVPYLKLRELWNKCLQPLGYIRRYAENQWKWHENGFRVRTELLATWPREKQLEAYWYGLRTGWSNPNTTDIHALKRVKNVVAYVVKYVSKNEPSRSVEGRIWGCSDDIRELERFELQDDAQLLQLLQHSVESGECHVKHGDGWSFYTCDVQSMLETWCPGASALFMSHWQAQAATLSGLPYIHIPQTKKPPPQ